MVQRDTRHWQGVAQSDPPISWQDRSEIAARFIRPGDTVLDLGCGAQTLRRFLPKSVGYIPVDCVKAHPDTWIADFDRDFTLPDGPFNVVACMGLFPHLKDPEALLSRLANAHHGTFIIFTTDERRRRIAFERYVAEITPIMEFHHQPIMTGILDSQAQQASAKRALSELICAHASVPHVLSSKSALFIRKVKNGGNKGTRKTWAAIGRAFGHRS